jgi:hypothetical protein
MAYDDEDLARAWGEVTALPPPIAARIGLPSIGWTQELPCSISPSTYNGAFAVRDGRFVEHFD